MDQFAFVNQVSNRLQLAVSKAQPDVIRKEAQALHEALLKLSKLVPVDKEPTDMGRQQAAHGLQLIVALAGNGMTSLLLDGPQLFPMLSSYMQAPWVTTGVAPLAFAVVYNLCQLNLTRLGAFLDASGLAALSSYISAALVANPGQEAEDKINQKLNLALALLYQIGSPKNGQQTRFIEQGGLSIVLDHLKTSKSALVFLSSFIDLQTPVSVVDIILTHSDFAEMVDSMYAEEPDSDDDDDDDDDDQDSMDPEAARKKQEALAKTQLVVQVLRNLCLLQGSADTVLPLLARFLGHSLIIADEAISALSNLSGTQTVDFRYAWDSSLIGMVLSKATQLCEKLIKTAKADVAAPVANRNLIGRKNILTRVFQILRNDECIKAAAESTEANRPGQSQADEGDNANDSGEDSDSGSEVGNGAYDDELVLTRDDAVQLVALAKLNTDLLRANQSWARTLARYLILLPSQVVWEESEDITSVVASGAVIELDDDSNAYTDQDWDLKEASAPLFAGPATSSTSSSANGTPVSQLWRKTPLHIMWRRLSRISPLLGTLPPASESTVVQGEFNNRAIATVLAGLAKQPLKLIKLFRLPSTKQSEWSKGAISVNLFDFRDGGKPVNVTIDDRVPCYPFSVPIGIWSGSTQTWLPLLEKACAKLLGGYGALVNLTVEQVGLLLTGNKPVKCKLPAQETLATVIESELSEGSLMIYTSDSESTNLCLIDSVHTTSEGLTVLSYNPAQFDLRRGWDSTSGHVTVTLSQLHATITSLYKLKL